MIVTQFKGHKLSNGMSAIAFHYPRITNGRDMINDIAKATANKDDPNLYPVLLRAYAAFRMAGDPEASKKSVDKLLNEVNVFDPEEGPKFIEVMTKLLNEKSKKD